MDSRRSQEGLEVVDPPLAVVSLNAHSPQAGRYYSGYGSSYSDAQTYHDPGFVSDRKEAFQETTMAVEPKRKSRRAWFIALLVLAIIAVAAIGGVLGETLGKKQNKSTSDSSIIPPHVSANSTTTVNSGGLLPTSSQPSVCHGGICASLLTTITWSNKQFIFGLTTNKSLAYKSGDGNTWDSQWTDLGGSFIYPPAVVSWGDGRIDIMGVSTNTGMFWKSFQNGAWASSWTSIGGLFTSAPTATCWGPQRIDLFGRGTDGALWHNYFGENGVQNWATWESLGGIIVGPPSVASWGNRRLDIFARGTDNALWHIFWDGVWHSWESLGGNLVSDAVVVSSAVNLLDVFVLGVGNALCWRGFHNAWLAWQCLGNDKSFESTPVPVVLKSDRVDVVGVGSDDKLYHKSMAGSTWSSNWDDLGGPMNSSPAGVVLSSSQAAMFGVGMDGQLYTTNVSSTSFSWRSSSGWNNIGGQFVSIL